jgi:outer membrane immunogenic protein
MRNQFLAATALTTTIAFLVPGIALAAPSYDWSGFYVGLGVGAVSSQSSLDLSGVSAVSVPSTISIPALGADGTVKLGYNWQSGQFVYGLENDLSIVSLHGSASGTDYTVTDSLNTLLSLRARFGVAFDRMMLFTTAGLAAGNSSFNADVGKGSPASANGTVVGGVVGAGIEYAVNDNVSLTATGTYYSLSSLHAVGDAGKGVPPFTNPYDATYTPRGMVFEAGINVHF